VVCDVAIVGAGPAGSCCAALCAEAGLKTVIIERSIFPREKVCGDCVNPACWPIFDRLGISEQILAQPHVDLTTVEFVAISGASISVQLPKRERGEIAIKRSLLDGVLLDHAKACGAELREGSPVRAIATGWSIETADETFSVRVLVAADGRNSTVARLLGILPPTGRDRIAIQSHIPASHHRNNQVTLRFVPQGYCGLAPVNRDELNLCLVSKPAQINALKEWAINYFSVPADQTWRTIAPLSRKPVSSADDNLFLVGDAGRVVEPFTGEGIHYALATASLAAEHIIAQKSSHEYQRKLPHLYAGRLWINELARQAVLHPRCASGALSLLKIYPRVLANLTSRIVRS
jgi:flavin-dependent dehydrogenase